METKKEEQVITNEEENGNDKKANAQEETKTYTEEDVQKLLQSETDKVRTDYSKKLKATTDELNKYKPKTKTQAEIDLENRLKALEDKEKEVDKKEKILNIQNKLKEQGLPSGLGKYLTGADDVETEINSLKEMFNNAEINNSYKPTQTHGGGKDSITKEQFMKMGYKDRLNIFKTNKELYDRLSK